MLFQTRFLLFFLFFFIFVPLCRAQVSAFVDTARHKVVSIPLNNRTAYVIDDSITYLRICKAYITYLQKKDTLFSEAKPVEKSSAISYKHPVLILHGNVSYEYQFRSLTDSFFNTDVLRQHFVKTSIHLLYKDQYPIQVNFVSRQANSSFFPNYTDASIQFDKYSFDKNLKEEIYKKAISRMPELTELQMADARLHAEQNHLQEAQRWLKSPEVMQKFYEEQESVYKKRIWDSLQHLSALSARDSVLKSRQFKPSSMHLISDTLSKKIDSNKYAVLVDAKLKEVQEREKKIHNLEQTRDSLKKYIDQQKLLVEEKIRKASSAGQLKKLLHGTDSLHQRKNFQEVLTDIKKFNLGRSNVNYSELTAWNINLTGIDVAYHPSLFFAFAAGKIDFGFRDFFAQKGGTPKQSMVLGRVGLGNVENKALLFTVFAGKKYNYARGLYDSAQQLQQVYGYSIEGIIHKNAHDYVSLEYAKSNVASTPKDYKQDFQKLLHFSDPSNAAIIAKGAYQVPGIKTSVKAVYRHSGSGFQSFSLYTYNTSQTSWSLSAEQPIFRNRINIQAALRQNDFINPIAEQNYKTTAVFTSLQVNARFPKWPSFSIGYFPGTQLYFINKDRLKEHVYYLVNASSVYQYALGGLRTSSFLNYYKFYNQSTDSGFIAYRGENYLFTQTFFLRKIQLSGSYAFTNQQDLVYSTIEAGIDFSMNAYIRLGLNGRRNKVATESAPNWGCRLFTLVDLKNIGTFRLQYDKSYLPTIHKNLFPIESGNATWIKYF